jgi:predicted lipoprotein with Yx(FWY)xxD motif
MDSKLVFSAGLVAAALATAACGSASSGNAGAYGAPPASPSVAPVVQPSASPAPVYPTPTVAPGTKVDVASTRLGQILVDAKGRTLYVFLADMGTRSACNSAACVQYWPPVLTKGAPLAGAGVNVRLLGTTTRLDGTKEVTYAGHPLYYFISDTKSGDVTGQGINGFGGPWYVVSPSGMRIV